MRRAGLIASVSLAWLTIVGSPAAAASYHVYVCGSWTNNQGPLVATKTPKMTVLVSNCGAGGSLFVGNGPGIATAGVNPYTRVGHGANAGFTATAPPGLTITHLYTVNDNSDYVGDGHGWWGEFFWNGGPGAAGRSGQITDDFHRYGCCAQRFDSRTAGWFIDCNWSSCSNPGLLWVGGVDLTVDENQRPWLVAPSGLWRASGWVRDRWQLSFYGDSPSGVCSLAAWLNGQAVTLGPGATVGRNIGTWHQCAVAGASATVQTADYGEGAMPLLIDGCDAAGACTGFSYTKTIYVDNSHPWVSLRSPRDVPVTAGPQFVTATAGGSPSGIGEIDCRVDGGPVERFAEGGSQHPLARIPVIGLGEHTVSCIAANTAVAQDGSHAWSLTPAVAGLKIGEPTVSAISFLKVVDALRCSRATKRIKIPGRWVTVWRHHRPVWVRRRPHAKLVHVTRCHPRIVRRRVTVWVMVNRNGRKVRVRRTKVIRVALAPRVVGHGTRWVRHGRSTTVSGWVGTAGGVALGGQTVDVYTSPDNHLGQFSFAAAVRTAADGGWTARLPAGPSRLAEAVYAGSPTTEPSVSGQVRVIVPAAVRLVRVSPRRVAWGGTVRITGQLLGGYLPPGGALVRLRIGYGSAYTTYGVQEHVMGDGRFTTTYTFGLGDPRIYHSYWFQIASLPMGSYPWAPAASRRLSVIVGGHPSRH
jgi:hypothetical protein